MRIPINFRSVTVTALTVGCLLATTGFLQAEGLNDLVPEGAKVKKVAGDFKFTEGPAYSPDGYLLFSDIPNNRIVKLNAEGTTEDYLKPSGRANGLMFDAAGNLYACQGGARQVARITSPDEEPTVLADTYDGKKLNSPNDLALDAQGGLYFTDPRYGQGEPVEQPVMGVYYISSEGKVSRVIEDLDRPNGVLVSPNGKWLYVAEPNHGQIFRYPIQGPGQLAAGQLIFTGDEELDGRGPDGMAHDVHGNLYATYSGIVALDPDGNVLGRVSVPERPANCAFGGEDNQTLYITARTSLYSLPMKVKGMALQKRGPSKGSNAQATSQSEAKKTVKTREVKVRDITLKVPENWKQEKPSNRLRLSQFQIPAAKKDKEGAELVIYSFGGAGGGIDANIKRWIGQFQAKGRKAKITSGTSPQGKYVFVDLKGTYNKPVGPPILRKTEPMPGARMLSVILSVEGKGNYFLKMTGSKKTVSDAAKALRNSFGADAKKEKEYKLGEE